MKALQISPEQQVGFMLGKLGEISLEMRLSREADARMEEDLSDIKKKLATGETTFALQGQTIIAIDSRLKVVEARDAARESDSKKVPPWWVTTILAPVIVVALIALMWFLVTGIAARAPMVPQVKVGP
jgi:hypothetical protein